MDSVEVFQELLLFMCMLLDRRMARETGRLRALIPILHYTVGTHTHPHTLTPTQPAGFGDCSEDLAVSNLRAMKSLLLSTTER